MLTSKAIVKTSAAIPGQYAGRFYRVDKACKRTGDRSLTGCRNTTPSIASADDAARALDETVDGPTGQA